LKDQIMQQGEELVKEELIPDFYNEIDAYGDPETSLLRNLVNFKLYNDAGQVISFTDLGEGKSLGTLVGEVVEPLPMVAKQRIMERSCTVIQVVEPALSPPLPVLPATSAAGTGAGTGVGARTGAGPEGTALAGAVSESEPPLPPPVNAAVANQQGGDAAANTTLSAWFETEKIFEEVTLLIHGVELIDNPTNSLSYFYSYSYTLLSSIEITGMHCPH
jgi:hypothetical protein